VSVGFHIDGAQFRINSMTLKDCVAIAYQMKVSQISGPDWISTQRYQVAATIPPGFAGREREMLQVLLTQRFNLKIHREKRDFSVYALVVGKGPLKLKESPADTDADDPDPKGNTTLTGGGSAAGIGVNLGHGASYSFAPNHFSAKKLTMAQFAANLERFADRPIVDMTDLKARYDLDFDVNAEDYQPMLIRAAVNAGVGLPPQALRLLDTSSSAGLADAVAQTGLKLDARKAPLDVIVVDDALKTPIAN
jgi:uncharacterized protein (TIGR03435 family)